MTPEHNEVVTERGRITDFFKITEGYVHCSRCGARCSPDLRSVDGGHIVIRAWVECPECLQERGERVPAGTGSAQLEADADRIRVLEGERDAAREQCGHEKHMRRFANDELDTWIRKWMDHEKICPALHPEGTTP